MTAPIPIRPSADSDLPQVGEVVAQRYAIERFIARGGMSHVFAARHVGLGSVLALKVLDPKLFRGVTAARVRFEREARLASRLRHPSIVEVFDVGVTESGIPFIAMELLDGPSLSKVLRQHAPMPWPQTRELMLQILDALQIAHAAGVVHRDVKPENCLILRGTQHLKLLDFGIARVLHETQVTVAGSVMGTPHYLSPEQARGATTDARTDVYSAGVVLYEMLTGHCPFEVGTTFEIVGAHITEPPPPLSDQIDVGHLPDGLPELMDRVLAKNPEHRPPTAGSFAEELRALDAEASRGFKPAVWIGAATAAFVLGLGGVGVASALSDDPSRMQAAFMSAQLEPRSTSPDVVPTQEAESPMAPKELLAEPFDPSAEEESPSAPPEPAPPEVEAPVQPEDLSEAERVEAERVPARPVKQRKPRNSRTSRKRQVERKIRKAASSCKKFVPPGGAQVSVAVEVNVDGDLQGTQIKPPYAGSVLGRCVAQALGHVDVGAGPTLSFAQRVRIGGGR